jgi:hypothetical protein
MKLINSLSIALAATAMLAISAPVTAFSQMNRGEQGRNNGKIMHRGNMCNMGSMDGMGDMMGMCIAHADKMGLTDDQMMKMKPAHREMQKKQARFEADLKIAKLELAEIMEVKDFNLEKAGSAVKKIAEIKTAHHLEMLAAMKGIRTTLTDEQFKEMKKMMPMKAHENRPGKKMMKKLNRK